jgi:hypothetical protein
MDGYHVLETLKVLQELPQGVDEADVAHLEYSFLPILDDHSVLPKTIHRQLARDPLFFIDCLTRLYKARGLKEGEAAAAEDPIEDEASKAIPAIQIWRLFRNWRILPGSDENGRVSYEGLRKWILEVRLRAETLRRLEVCDITIGSLFARSAADEDGAIPLIPVRDIIEECKSDDLERGLVIGLQNLRGTHWRGLHEGGTQERELASVYTRHAVVCQRWSRTANLLMEVARQYEREAKREDERAEAEE